MRPPAGGRSERPSLPEPPRSAPAAVVEIDGAVVETAFVQQLQVRADAVRDGTFAASDEGRYEEQPVLVDEAGLDRVRRKLGTAHAEVTGRGRLQRADGFGVEVPLDASP